MSGRTSVLLEALVLAGWLVSVSPALARGRQLAINLADCGSLAADRISRQLRLERGEVLRQLKSDQLLRVAIVCGPSQTMIAITDPLTQKRVERAIPTPGAGADPERVLAIAASQLMLASWLELLTEPEASDAPGEPDEPGAAEGAARRMAVVAARHAVPRRSLGLGVAAGGVVRDLSQPIWLWNARMLGRVSLVGSLELLVGVGVEQGSAERTSGTVSVLLLDFRVGAAYRWALWRGLSLDAGVAASLVHARFEGHPASESYAGTSAQTLAAQGTAELGLWWRLSRFRLGVALQVGGTAPRTTADVVGERAVELHGLWLGSTGGVELLF
jgi:hypothetical protein